jgi:hypothetical protein
MIEIALIGFLVGLMVVVAVGCVVEARRKPKDESLRRLVEGSAPRIRRSNGRRADLRCDARPAPRVY